jgi:hypothetical protein
MISRTPVTIAQSQINMIGWGQRSSQGENAGKEPNHAFRSKQHAAEPAPSADRRHEGE